VSVATAMSSRARLQPLVLATAIAGVAGALLGVSLAAEGPDASRSRAVAPEPRIGLASGVARIALPAGWEPLRRRSTLPGLTDATAVRGVHAEAALDIRAPEDASLLPAALASGQTLPAPRPRRLDARIAWRYDLAGAEPGSTLVALVLPTTGGVVTIACAAPAAELERAAGECEQAVRAVRLDDAWALVPRPDTAAAIVLPHAIAQLNRRRRSERRRLAATWSPVRRSAAARRLGAAYAATAERLRPLAAGDALPVTAKLAALAREHRALASASLRRDADAAARAGATIERDERRLDALLAAVTRPPARG
jgi:hypothetical protein